MSQLNVKHDTFRHLNSLADVWTLSAVDERFVVNEVQIG